jgi:DNA modification methylase
MGIPWRVAFALQADGWYLRDCIVWHKPSPMPGSQRDRCTSSYEFIFQLTKRAKYYFDMDAILEPASHGSNGS